MMKDPHHQTAFSIICKNPNVLLDDEPLDDLLEDIASALQDAFDLGFKAAGGSIHPIQKSAPPDVGSLPSGESDPSVTLDLGGADT